ncbi:MAG: Y-family DNA polymerase, partial [Candidatus Heimdallarchaeota archaeon]
FHVDLDCFYAAVEMREDPTLVGKPIIVGGDKETKRGVVLTCNYEARKFGLHSGMPVRKALELCPEALCVSSHRSMYKEVSQSIMSILSSYTDAFRSASIDEAYLNLTKEVYENYNGDPIPLAQEIKDEIFEEERITCSIGIGPNTSIAKIATSQNKPDGITYVRKEDIKDFLYPLNVRRLSGIGPKSATSLKNKHSIETIGQIIDIGTSGQGRTVVEPSNSYGVKSISRGRTFYGSVKDGEPVTAESLLPKLIENVHDRLKKRLFRFKTVTLEVKLQKGLRTLNRSRSFLAANDDKERITITAFELLNEVKKQHPKQPIRKIAIRVSNFERLDPQQKTLAEFFK